jgi:hypothetical protein
MITAERLIETTPNVTIIQNYGDPNGTERNADNAPPGGRP